MLKNSSAWQCKPIPTVCFILSLALPFFSPLALPWAYTIATCTKCGAAPEPLAAPHGRHRADAREGLSPGSPRSLLRLRGGVGDGSALRRDIEGAVAGCK